jgi:hypothetical protein
LAFQRAVVVTALFCFTMGSLSREQFSFYAYYFGLILLVASLPLSKFGMSLAQFFIAGSWLMSGDFRGKLKSFVANKTALVLSSLFLLHVLGLLWTSDFEYAFKDLRIKLPLLLMPFLLATSPPLSKKQFDYLLMAVIGGVTVSTFISMFVYWGLTDKPVHNIRDISIFISHIRLVLICCVAVFASAWLIWDNRGENKYRYTGVLAFIIIWLSFFVFFIQGLTGMVILTLAFTAFWIVVIIRSADIESKAIALLMLIVPGFYIWSTVDEVTQALKPREGLTGIPSETHTPSGNPYTHDPHRIEFENGYPVWVYLCEDELREEWNRKSRIAYDSTDERGQELRITLIRYLTSKGLKKDGDGLRTLVQDEILLVERGVANVYYRDMTGFRARLHQVAWEIANYRAGGDPSGHSVAQRLEFWKAALHIIKDHPVIGTGTGDVPSAFRQKYEEINSRLSERWRLRSHNQFLAIGVSFGITGFLWFLYTLIYPLIGSYHRRNLLYLAFAAVAWISMMTEDTLETQAGVTFFALFSALFLFVYPQKADFRGNRG